MRAIALFGVFILVKVMILTGHSIPLSVWTPIAYFWQDIMVALTFAALDAAIRRPWLGWTLYAAAVAYAAVNVPVARVLSSPLTWPMMRAAGGALSDSIWHHVTPANVALMSLVIATAIALPLLLKHIQFRGGAIGVVVGLLVGLLVVLAGPFATSRVETIGLHRNALAAIVASSLPRLSASAARDHADEDGAEEDWRASPFDEDSSTTTGDLGYLQGVASDRNVVLVLLESTGARYLRSYGAGLDPMPHVTALARESIVFENAYAVYPESIKTLYSVLCARYPAADSGAVGVAGSAVSGGSSQISTPSIAHGLKAAGYRTALFHSGRFMYLGMDEVVGNKGYELLEDAGAIGGKRESSFGVDEPATVRRMLAWIDGLPRKDRFFLTYLPIAGHHPYNTPEPGPFPEREESDRYLNALHWADASFGAFLEGLRARGLCEKTLFIICGDHGEAFGQHEGNFGHSLFIYDENIRVPYLIAAPGLVREQVRVSRTVSLMDTAPTILDLIGLPIPAGYQGRSMLNPRERMVLFFTDYSLRFVGMRDGCWKYIYEHESGRSKLFNLCADPEERHDVAIQSRERIDVYRAHLERWGTAQTALVTPGRRP